MSSFLCSDFASSSLKPLRASKGLNILARRPRSIAGCKIDVIRDAAENGCNLIITHEPIYYQTPDYPQWFAGFENHVANAKNRLINENHVTVWRDHDHMHAHKPDSIFDGVFRELGWNTYLLDEECPEMTYLLEMPETNAKDIADHLKKNIGLNGIRIIGNQKSKIKRLAFVAHLYPGAFGAVEETDWGYNDYSTEIIKLMVEHDVQAIIPGEIIEWTVLSYIRDAAELGENKICFNIGHFNWEELGMKRFSRVIRDLVREDIPVIYIPSGDIASYM